MKRYFIPGSFLMAMLCVTLASTGQNTLKLRISGNSSRFISEPQGDEVLHPDVQDTIILLGPFTDFTHKGMLGLEAELMLSLTDKVYVGFEVGSDRLTGENDKAGPYNFQYTDQLQLYSFGQNFDTIYWQTRLPLKYQTNLINFVGNLRIYPAPYGRFKPYIKASAGIALVGTELKLKLPGDWETAVLTKYPDHTVGEPVLYSRGGSGAPEGYKPALLIGGGIGFEYQITEKIALYGDGSYRLIHSDIVDGKPNMDFNANSGKLVRFNTNANTSKFSFGIVYTLNDDIGLLGGGSITKKGGPGKEGRTSPHLPFFKLKRF